MKRALATLLIVATTALPTATDAVELSVTARETLTIEFPGATAAFAVDPTTVETSIVDSRLVLIGRHVGQTLVTVVQPQTTETLTVRVEPAPKQANIFDDGPQQSSGFLDVHYDSAARRFGTSFSAAFEEGERSTRVFVYGVREQAHAGQKELWSLPNATLEFKSPERSITLLDERVETSPLTLVDTLLRGFHLRQGAFELHTGVAAPTLWDARPLPGRGDRALALSYRSDGETLRLLPTLLWLPDSHAKVPGVASFGLEYGTSHDELQLKGELGWSAQPGASFDLALRNQRRQVWLAGAVRPKGFAALSVARPAGSYLDGAWAEQLGERLTGSLTVSATRLDLERHQPQAVSGRFDMRYRAAGRWTLVGGLGGGSYRDVGIDPLRRSTISMGGSYDTPALGLSALYRYQTNSAADRGGHGARLTMRGAYHGWKANLFIDGQQQATTLGLLLGDSPELARALAELGFVATDPDDILRLLRDHGPLFAEHGVEIGPLRRDPLRLEGGLNLSWRDSNRFHWEFGLRMAANETQSVFRNQQHYLNTLYASWRIQKHIELSASYTWWSMRRDDSPADKRQFFQLALRTNLPSLRFPTIGERTITGWVVRDDELTGIASLENPPLAGIEVVLDGWRRTRTDRDGRFRFDSPGQGQHRVEVVLPREPGAYFTAPSTVTVPAGGEAGFAVTFAAPQLTGTLRSDAGLPLAGVRIQLEGTAQATTQTDSMGEFRFSAPAGEVRVSVIADSVPAGYALGDLAPQIRRLAPATPAVVDFTVRAERSLQGLVRGGNGEVLTITAIEIQRSVQPDANGRFLLRSLPAGPLTLLVKSSRGETRRHVEIPAEPSVLQGIELDAP